MYSNTREQMGSDMEVEINNKFPRVFIPTDCTNC